MGGIRMLVQQVARLIEMMMETMALAAGSLWLGEQFDQSIMASLSD